MKDLLQRARSIDDPKVLFRESIPVFYEEVIRPLLPRTGEMIKYNGVIVEESRKFDHIVPDLFTKYVQTEPDENYEGPLISMLRATAESGDSVTIVGGGEGVTAVVAANAVGTEGTVNVYEGSARHAAKAQGTCELNNVEKNCTIHHAIVGEAISLRGVPSGASVVEPKDLPQCDVLELDCEGAEIGILNKAVKTGAISPRAIVVETHGLYDSPPEKVSDILSESGYTIVERETLKEHDGIEVFLAIARDQENLKNEV